VELLSGRLYVLDAALKGIGESDPFELFLDVRPAGAEDAGSSFAAQLGQMYVAWGRQRGMDVELLATTAQGGQLLAISGLGCWRLLAPESGLHVLEIEASGDGTRAAERETARVRVAPREPGPRLEGPALAESARVAIDDAPAASIVVRRYRTGPSPLVRDSARGYRTGHLDRVLAGDFDLG
jgi:ATP-dependent Clp protease ATP-binding subunit ClpC